MPDKGRLTDRVVSASDRRVAEASRARRLVFREDGDGSEGGVPQPAGSPVVPSFGLQLDSPLVRPPGGQLESPLVPPPGGHFVSEQHFHSLFGLPEGMEEGGGISLGTREEQEEEAQQVLEEPVVEGHGERREEHVVVEEQLDVPEFQTVDSRVPVTPQETARAPSGSSVVVLRRDSHGRMQSLRRGQGLGSSSAAASTSSGAASTSTVARPQSLTRAASDTTGTSWELTAPAPGGPEILDVIPSFGGHVAYGLWSNPLDVRRGFRTYTRAQHLGYMRTDWKISEEMQVHLDASGLFHLRDCLPSYLDTPLLLAFLERWQPDTNTFHMPFGEMTIMLHDVAEILMLPIEGRVCGGGDGEGRDTARADMMRLFGCTDEQLSLSSTEINGRAIWTSGVVSCLALLKMVGNADLGASDAMRAQAYLLDLIGSTVLVDKSGDGIRPGIFSLLRDLDAVSGYAWGAGTLAWLYRSLGVASRAECSGLDGCLGLLQCWIYEYFPTLRPVQGMRLTVRDDLDERRPRSSMWPRRGARRVADDVAVRELRTTLDQMTADRVCWCPYGPQSVSQFPRTVFRGVIRCLDIMEPYHPDRVLRQIGYVQTIPMSIILPDRACRPRKTKTYKVEFRGRGYDQSWGFFPATGLKLSDGYRRAVRESEVVDEYTPWYNTRSHPLIVDPSTLEVPRAHDRSQIVTSVSVNWCSFYDKNYFIYFDYQ